MSFKISGFELDSEQRAIVLDENKYLLVTAGAGSGKTLTILGKIKYLIKEKNIKPEEILCISFTKAAAESLKNKIKSEFNLNMPVYTFHKLSLEILQKNQINYNITDSDMLENIIHKFLAIDVLEYEKIMKNILYYFDQEGNYNIKKKYLNFYKYKYKYIDILEKLLTTFLHLFKCNNWELNDFVDFSKKIKWTLSYKKYKKEKIFLILAINIYLKYEKYLNENNEIDFDDMILKATNIIKKSKNIYKYKYIIIDEYQDTSYIRFLLIRELINITNANLMVVGDDFQSIYRFTGCDISLFLNFNNYFKDAKILKIQTTYRNSQELINIAGSFVMKNKNQIRKNLQSTKRLKNPIRIIYYDDIKNEFKKLINDIYKNCGGNILVLGRNNNDVKMILSNDLILKNNTIIFKSNKEINIKFMTVHKSKGLESDNVIIINLKDDILGFPSQIKEERILRLVSNNFDSYPYSEERRLFYVALTRTKNYVYLLTPKKNASVFVKEIKRYINKRIDS